MHNFGCFVDNNVLDLFIMKKKVKMTLDKLAGMVARGFEKTATKEELKTLATKEELKTLVTKDEFNQRLNAVERKIDKVDFRVDQVHEILDRGEKDFLGLQRRVQVLEKVNKPHHI